MIRRRLSIYKRYVIFICCVCLCLMTAWILYTIFGRQFMRAMYEGRMTGPLNRILSAYEIKSIKVWHEVADQLFFGLSYYILLFCTAVFFGFSRYPKKVGIIFYAFVIGYALFWVYSIIKMSFVFNGIRYFTLFDDGMVSMRYAKNLANGYGLVWNLAGARIEGYTNLLWVIYMALWHLFPISAAKISLTVQITGLIFLISYLFLVRRISLDISEGNNHVSIAAVVLTASYSQVSFWALRGMETSVLGFIILLAVWRILNRLKDGKPDLPLFIVLGIGMLVRIDFLFLFTAVSMFMLTAMPQSRKKNIIFASIVLLLIVGGQTLFRWFYYNDMFPNSYYVKMTGVTLQLRVQRGLWAAKEFIKTMSWPLFVFPFVYCVFRIRDKRFKLLLYIFLVQFFYSIYVGGDVWEKQSAHMANRFLCIVMPVFFILASLTVSFFIEKLTGLLRASVVVKRCCFAVLVPFIVVQLHGGFGIMLPSRLVNHMRFNIEKDKEDVRFGLRLKEITTPDARIAISRAGIIPYFLDRYSIDMLGKMDTFIAHQKARIENYKDFRPGHNKWDYAYSIGMLKPDIVAQLWRNLKEASPFLNMYYECLEINGNIIFCRRDSSNIYWTKLKNMTLDQEDNLAS